MRVQEPRIGVVLRCETEPEALRSYAETVEALGFDELWTIEDCFFAGGVSATTLALASTERLQVGMGILPAVMRNPATAAMEIAALARFFPGRVLGGFGHGVADWMRQIGAFPDSQLAALGETTDVVRRLLAGEAVTVNGRHVHLEDVRLAHPPAELPPIYLGVRARNSLRLAGRLADGTLLSEWSGPGYLRWVREQVDLGRAEAGRTDRHRIAVYVAYAPGADGEQAVRAELAEMILAAPRQVQLQQLGLADEAATLAERVPDAGRLAREIPAAWVHQMAVTGTPRQCAQSLQALAESGADTIILRPTIDPVTARQQLEVAARDVLPLLPAAGVRGEAVGER